MSFMFPSSDDADTQLTLLGTILQALEVTGRVPDEQPETGFPHWFTADRIKDFYLEQLGGGWVSTITFRDMPHCLGSPDAMPYSTPQEAFLHGAGIVCELVTGSRDLPFVIVGNTLVVTAYRA